jgi:hypothetical protein
MLGSLHHSDNALYLLIVQCRSFFKIQQELNLFARHTMTLQHYSFPSCFSSIGMYEEFLIVITQLNNVSLDVGCESTSEVFNQWVSRCTEWNFQLSFSDSDYKTHVKLKQVTTVERSERCPSILLWINIGRITSQNHQVPHFFWNWNCFLSVLDYVTISSMKRMVVNMIFAVFENFQSVSSI